MIAVLLGVLFVCLLLGFPMMVGMTLAPVLVVLLYFPNVEPYMLAQYFISGISSFTLLAIPMFMFAGNIMGSGQMASRLMNLVKTLVGHLPGGLAITAGGTCTIFGAISGSANATLVAVGMPMFKPLRAQGYNDSHIASMLMTNANIALLIPPSVVMVIYCSTTGTSVGDMFIAGIIPGLLMFVAYAIYDCIYAKVKHIERLPRASLKEIFAALREAVLALGFPLLVLGGIYSGTFSPTEAAAVACVYAFVVEVLIYKSLDLAEIRKIAVKTGRVAAATYVLTGSGKVISWLLSYSGVAKEIAYSLLGENPSAMAVMIAISLVFLVACCFVDCIPLILIVAPIFFPAAVAAGIDPIHLGIIITFWSAFGTLTPPFGSNIFIAIAIFQKSFATVIKGLWPYVIISVLVGVALVMFPWLSTCLL